MPPQEGRSKHAAAFEELAGDLDFTLEHAPFEIGDHTDLGLLLIFAARTVTAFETARIGSPKEEDAEIEGVVQGFESLGPEEHAERIGDYAVDPFVVVHKDGIGVVDASRLDDDDVLEQMRQYALKTPRDVRLTNIQIVHLGGSRAAATYTADEDFRDGTSIHSNVVAILVKLSAGWRIAAISDRMDS